MTGAGRGIGRECALALARAGASVTLVSRTLRDLDAVAAEIDQLGGVPTIAVADVTDPEQVREAVMVAARAGDLRICVNAAGINRPRASTELPISDWDAVIATNVRGTFLVAREVARHLLRSRRGGRIINLSSQMGSVGYPGRAAYCASKHAVNGLTKALAVEWAASGVTVNAVAPTFVRTPMTETMLDDDELHREVLRRIPAGRLGDPSEVAAAVVFLASMQAALITGAVLPVDGGWVAW